MPYKQGRPKQNDTGEFEYCFSDINIMRTKRRCMPNIPKPWPKGLEVKDSKYNSLEDELWVYIKYRMQYDGYSIPTDAINYFLQEAFRKEDIRSELRSFMRYLSQDERFVFEGPSRVRMVRVIDRSEVEETEGWKVIAAGIVNFMLDITTKEATWRSLELNASDLFTHFEKQNGDKMLGFSKEAFDFAVVQLVKDNRILIKGEDTEFISFPTGFDWINEEYRFIWCNGSGFLGQGDKKSSGVRLPVRVWDRIEEITDKLNRDKFQLAGEQFLRMVSPKGGVMNPYEESDEYTDNALLGLIMQGHNQITRFTTTQIIEAAIELVNAEIMRSNMNDWEDYVEKHERFRKTGVVDMIVDGKEVEIKTRVEPAYDYDEFRF